MVLHLPYANFVNDFGGSATVAQALTPYPQYSKIFNNFEGFGTTYYQSAQIEFEKRFTNGLSFLAGYTLSRLMDNTSSGFSSFTSGGINKYNQKPEWAISQVGRTADPQSQRNLRAADRSRKEVRQQSLVGNIVGGWQVGWILDYEAGAAFGVSRERHTLSERLQSSRSEFLGQPQNCLLQQSEELLYRQRFARQCSTLRALHSLQLSTSSATRNGTMQGSGTLRSLSKI